MPDDTDNSQPIQDLNDRIDRMISEGLQENERWMQLWRDAQDYIFNNQLAGRDAKKGWERIQVNYIWPAVQQQIAMMAQRKPLMVAEGWEDTDTDGAAFWEPVLQWQFEHDLNLGFKAAAATLDANIYGFYVGRVYGDDKGFWDAREQRWQWRPRVSLVCPEYFFADPECENIDEAAYVGSSRRARTEKAVSRWPNYKKEIEEEAQKVRDGQPPIAFLQQQLLATREDEQDAGIKQDKKKPVEGRLVSLLRKVREGPRDIIGTDAKKGIPRYVTLTEIFFRDDTEVTVQEPDEEIPAEELLTQGLIGRVGGTYVWTGTGELVAEWPMRPGAKRKIPKFPYGRRILRVGKTILNKKDDDQVWPYSRWPFVVGVNALLPHLWRGVNGVEPAKGLQDWINVSASHLCNYVKFFGDPVVMVEKNALEDHTNISNKLRCMAGAIWELAKNGIAKIKRDPPPPLHPGVLQLYDLFTREIQDQLGMQEIARGRQSKGKATATEIAELSRTSRIRTAWTAQMQDVWIQQVMSLVGEFDQKNMQPGDMVRLAGQEHAPTAMQIPEGMNDIRFDIKLRVGTELPHDQEKRKQEYVQLFELLGIPILEELLDAFQVPNKGEVMARVDAWQQIQEFLQMQAQLEQEQGQGEKKEAGATQGAGA